MRGATMAFVRAWLTGIGAFTAITAAFCVALTIAIGGPPSPSEIAGFQLAAADALRELDNAGQRARGKLCAYLPPEQRQAASCETGAAETPVSAPVPAPVPAPIPAPVAAPASPRVIVADVDTVPTATATPVSTVETIIIAPRRHAARAAPARRPHAARRAAASHRDGRPAHRARHVALAGGDREPPHARRLAAPAVAAHSPARRPRLPPAPIAPPEESPALEPAAVSANDAEQVRGGAHAHASTMEEPWSEEAEPAPDSEDPPPDEPPPDFETGVKK